MTERSRGALQKLINGFNSHTCLHVGIIFGLKANKDGTFCSPKRSPIIPPFNFTNSRRLGLQNWGQQLQLIKCADGGMVYTRDLKSLGFTALRVRVPLCAPKKNSLIHEAIFLWYRDLRDSNPQACG